MLELFGNEMLRAAAISPCGIYRYSLTRTWGSGPAMVFVMLNPSTADASADDPTVRRCIDFAKREGFSAMAVVNLTPYRATNPAELLTADLGSEAARRASMPASIVHCAGKVVVAWGAWGDRFPGLVKQMTDMLWIEDVEELWCLGTTKSGQPRHPLYLKKTTPLERWGAPDA